jgi:hypothetical protein
VALEQSEIPYALAGSIASMAWGEPRATLDIDVVVVLEAPSVPRLRALFPAPAFYMDEQVAAEAARRRSQFNVIHPESGIKIDFFIAGDAIQRAQVGRRIRRRVLPDLEGYVSPPEELIIMKLRYYGWGGSEKHLRDVAAMIQISGGSIDLEHVRDLAEEHGLARLWEELRGRIGLL